MINQLIQASKFEVLYFIGRINSESRKIPQINRTIYCRKEQVHFLGETPNTIIHFKVDGYEGYFRECRKHLEEFDFVKDLIWDFAYYVLDDLTIYEEMLKILSNHDSLKKFLQMGDGTNPYSPINVYRRNGNYSVLGIVSPSFKLLKELKRIVQYCWGPIAEYKYCRSQKNRTYNLYNSSKSITTYKIAKLLGIEEIIPKTYYAKLVLDGKERIGVIVEPSSGICPQEGNGFEISGLFQRDTLNLQMLDVLTHQLDHRPGNYFVSVSEQNVVISLSAFDNDAPTTLLPLPNISQKTYCGCSPLFKNGSYNRKYIDANLLDAIINIDINDFNNSLKGYCSNLESFFISLRLKKIVNILKNDNVIALDDAMWSKKTVYEEINCNDYGLTYLQLFSKKFN